MRPPTPPPSAPADTPEKADVVASTQAFVEQVHALRAACIRAVYTLRCHMATASALDLLLAGSSSRL